MKLFLLSCLLGSSLFGQSRKPENPKPDEWWLPHPASDLETKKPEIMKLIREGVAAYDKYQLVKEEEERTKAIALASKEAKDEEAWQVLHEKLIAAQKGMKKLDDAIELTAHAYGVRPKTDTIQNGPMAGTKRAWEAKFRGPEASVREVKDHRGAKHYIDVPEADEEEDRAITKDDGFTAVRIAAFRDAVTEGNPSSLAGTLYHEAVHYTRLVTRDSTHAGWKSREEEEDFALEKKLKAKTILGLSPKQIRKTEEDWEDYKGPARDIKAGILKGTLLFLASIQESANQEEFMRLKLLEESVERETSVLRNRLDTRQSIRNLQAMADRACMRPHTMNDGEADSFERSYSGSWNEDIGLNPNSALETGLMGCQFRMLEKLLSERSSSGRAFTGKGIRDLAQSVAREERREVQAAIAELHALARKSCGRPGSLDGKDAWTLDGAFNKINNDCTYLNTCLPWVALDGLELGCVADTLHVFLLAKAKAAEESRNGRYVFIGADDLNAIGHRLASADPSEALWRLVLAQHEEEGRSALKGYAAKACLKPGSLTREDAGEIRKAYVLLDEYRLAARRGYTLPDSALQGLSGCVKEMMEFMLRSQQKYGTAPLGPWEEFYNSYSGEIARKYPSEQGGQNDRTQTSPEPGRVKLPSEDEIRRRMDDIRRRLCN